MNECISDYSLSDGYLNVCSDNSSDDEYLYYDENDVYLDLTDYSLEARASFDLTKTYKSLKINSGFNNVIKVNACNNLHPMCKNSQPWSNLLSNMTKRCNFDYYGVPNSSINNSAINNLTNMANRDQKSSKFKDKSDRATSDQVLDPRTRMILFKLLNKGYLTEINGCISTGKEANVYFGTGEVGDVALKIYRTSILIFKDRERYVAGEFRFRRGYSKHNPRKMVRMWGEKEMRNLLRITNAGIKCPMPHLLRSHVLIMEHIGEMNGHSAPKLKDIELSQAEATKLYRECLLIMWNLYHKARLVHADLSEYNILFHEGSLIVIDVAQSVERDHPNALLFLRKDCTNINKFFEKRGILVLTVKELFNFITDLNIGIPSIEKYIDYILKKAESRCAKDFSNEDKVNEEVFKQAHIPRTLLELSFNERDTIDSENDPSILKEILYPLVTGITCDLKFINNKYVETIISVENELENKTNESSSGNNQIMVTNQGNNQNDNANDSININNITRTKSNKIEWKIHKMSVKARQRVNRMKKIPKHIKKRKEKSGKAS